MAVIRTIGSALSSLSLTVLLICASGAAAQDKAVAPAAPVSSDQPTQPISDSDIQMLRTNLRSERKQVIAANMQLTSGRSGEVLAYL